MRNTRLFIPLLALLIAIGPAASRALADEAAFLYDPGTVNVIEMTLPPAGIQGLESDPFTYQAGGTVTVTPTDGTPDGLGAPSKTFQNVEIKLKGQLQGSFEDLDHKAAFKLKFKKTEPFFGLRKLTLNNMTQDPSMIHESLAYTAFAAAGVPASRAGYANVSLNGENYGLHLDLESLDETSLSRIFASPFDKTTQHLYEAAEYGADFYPGKESRFEVDEGPSSTADLTALIAAVDAGGAGAAPSTLSSLLDLEEMTRMWGVERYIGHWDGYAGEGIQGEEGFNEHRPNNYYLYSEPSGRFKMLPWGTDQTWERPLEFDEQDGRLFDLCLDDEPCANMFSTGVENALEKVGGLDLNAQATRTEAMLKPWQALEEDPRKPNDAAEIATAVDDTCDFIAKRPVEAENWLDGSSSALPVGEGCPPLPPPPQPPSEREPIIPASDAPRTPEAPPTSSEQPPPIASPQIHLLEVDKLGDRVRLRLQVDAAGAVVIRGEAFVDHRRRWVCGDQVRAEGPGALALVCRLSPRAIRLLRRRALPVALRATYTRDAGSIAVLSHPIRLSEIAARQHGMGTRGAARLRPD